ncbi:MAG: site-2 protease family protein [Candidatus Hydrogenedentes bacterium]|nr:site-2 protease family protein [Candidatus Hydrogenedentota bacterium]
MVLFDIAVFILVLGELVFFHELGHFLAAKACGIYCERFSLGMPPRLFGIKYGETDYCIGLLPIGGYVKMAGQEDVPMTDEQREKEYAGVPRDRWFVSKPVWQRMIVIVAGPFMNVVLALLLYGIATAMGGTVPQSQTDNRIGAIRENLPASTAPLYAVAAPLMSIDPNAKPDAIGWQTGDRVLSLNGEPVKNIRDIAVAAALNNSRTVIAEIERVGPDGKATRYLSPLQSKSPDSKEPAQFGVEPYRTALVGGILEGMPAQAAGMKVDDVILRLNGQTIDRETFTRKISELTHDESATIDVQRGDEILPIVVHPEANGKFQDIGFAPEPNWLTVMGDDEPLTVVYGANTFLSKTGFKTNDTITAIDGVPANSSALKRLKREGKTGPFKVTVQRPGGLMGLGAKSEVVLEGLTLDQILQALVPIDLNTKPVVTYITDEMSSKSALKRKDIIEEVAALPPGATYSPDMKLKFEAATAGLLENLKNDPQVGSVVFKVKRPALLKGLARKESSLVATLPVERAGAIGVVFKEKMIDYQVPAAQVVPEAFRLCKQATVRTVQVLGRLVTGEVHSRDLGGPMMIYQVTTQAAREGIYWLLEMSAFISINLAVFNLLPLPVLDGGHVVLLSIEGVRRRPVNAKVTEWVQQIGLVFIVGLLLYATFNDIRRWFENTILP